MTKAVIVYTNGKIQKLSLPGYDIDNMKRIVTSSYSGYPDLTVDHTKIWIDWRA